jgi:L-ascorbate metabolism protein UlaG (beta-lactamase superfamily)
LTSGVELRFLGTSGFEITTESGRRVVVDPFLCGNDRLPPSPVPLGELAGADVVLVTHGAYDHLGQALDIVAAGEATLVCGPEVRVHALAAGLPEARVAKAVPGSEVVVAGVRVKSLAAVHLSMVRHDGGWLSGVPLSFLIETDGGTQLFHSGDTALFGDLKLYGELYSPRIVMLCVGETEPALSPLPPEEAAIAADWLGAPYVVPMHFRPGDPEPAAFVAALRARRPDLEAVVLEPGGRWTEPVAR